MNIKTMSRFKESFLLNIAFPVADKVMGTCAMSWYKQIKQMNTWTKEQVLDWQNKQLQRFITHAYEHTVYYKRVFDELNLKPKDIQTAEDLKKLPIIDKEIVLRHFDEIVPDDIATIKYRKARTGGTTGEPMKYFCDESTWGYVTAAKIFYWKKTAYHYGDSFVALGSASLFSSKPSFPRRIYDKMRNEIALNGMNLSDEICCKYVEWIKKKKIHYLYGYAASLFLFAKYIVDHGVSLSVKAVFSTSEKLTKEYRSVIMWAFPDSVVMDCYGAKDAGITAYEMADGLYHVGYNVMIETIHCLENNSGTLLTTNFLNNAFPLIRYEFGDEAIISTSDNYNGQCILSVEGRTSDVMRLKNGRNVTGPGFTILMSPFDIVAYQIKQVNDLRVELQIQPMLDIYTKEQEEKIRQTIFKYIGDDCQLDIVYVDHFDPSANGKRKYFMTASSKIKQE